MFRGKDVHLQHRTILKKDYIMKYKQLSNNAILSATSFCKKVVFMFILMSVFSANAQVGTEKEFMWDSISREYIEYVPESYNASQPTAILFMLHGLRDSMQNKIELSGMLPFIDQQGWIIVVPQALEAEVQMLGQTFSLGGMWNAGMVVSVMGLTIAPNENVDDCGFLMALLDTMKVRYNIHPDSVFFSGISMGGFMAQRIAIDHSDKVSAIVSVSGTIATAISNRMPETNVDVMHIHGTSDDVVTYDGANFSLDPFGSFNIGLSAEQTVEYWRSFNGCIETPRSCVYNDTKDDGFTFERYDYSGGNARVAFIKVINGEHDWYASSEQYDIGYAEEIMKFFMGQMPTNVGIDALPEIETAVYPNPTTDVVNIACRQNITNVEVYNIEGRLVYQYSPATPICSIRMAGQKAGLYWAKIYTQEGTATKKIIVK